MISRRRALLSSLAGVAAGIFARGGSAQQQPRTDPPRKPLMPSRRRSGRTPVVMPNGTSLPYRMEGGVKVFHLVAEQVKREFAPGLVVNCYGYNGQTPGPLLEAFEGDRVRIYVTNHLPEGTSVHWHGFILPNGMDGVAGLNQPKIEPGETYTYEFTLQQSGTLMYHPHFDEMVQIAMGMHGFFVIHPRDEEVRRVDRDFAIFLNEWFIKPGTATPDPSVMLDFNTFTMNSKVFPATDPMLIRTGDRVRVRLANLSMNSHPIHIHGHRMWVTGTDAGPIPESGWWPENTINVPVGTTRDVEWTAEHPGDWAFHCHKTHHTMTQMGHGLPNILGVDTGDLGARVSEVVPGTMIMGENGMGVMSEHQMEAPPNSIPMIGGMGPYGPIDMGGMFTLFKVRDDLAEGIDPGWYKAPRGTVAWKVESTLPAPPAVRPSSDSRPLTPSRSTAPHPASHAAPAPAPPARTEKKKNEQVIYTCPMHPEIRSLTPGKCPKCGMTLVPKK